MIRQIADSFTIFFACLISNIFFAQSLEFFEILISTISLFLFLEIVFIPTLFITGIYSYVRNMEPKNRVIKLIQAAIVAAFLIILVFYFFNYYFTQGFIFSDLIVSDISFAWIIALIGMICSRILAYTYISNNRTNSRDSLSKDNENKVLVIGGAGYIGSSLLSQLLEKGYKVKVLDIFLFGEDPIADFIDHDNLEIINGDFRKIDDLVVAISGCHSVIHLGGIVGDPACSVDEALTKEVNLTASKIIGQISKSAGVKKFIFASSCSVYGAQNYILDEESETKPLSLYAKTKIASEKILEELTDKEFSPIFLRFGTVFGFSGRTRFDLVVNLLTANAFFNNKMTVYGKDQIRPFVHVNDAAKSIVCALESKLDVYPEKLVFNIGSYSLNVSLFDLASL